MATTKAQQVPDSKPKENACISSLDVVERVIRGLRAPARNATNQAALVSRTGTVWCTCRKARIRERTIQRLDQETGRAFSVLAPSFPPPHTNRIEGTVDVGAKSFHGRTPMLIIQFSNGEQIEIEIDSDATITGFWIEEDEEQVSETVAAGMH